VFFPEKTTLWKRAQKATVHDYFQRLGRETALNPDFAAGRTQQKNTFGKVPLCLPKTGKWAFDQRLHGDLILYSLPTAIL
jgi:hypothetical protein